MSEALLVFGLVLGLPCGYLAHELAHYIVLAAGGREPHLSFEQLGNPSVSYAVPRGRPPLDVRLAAVAPALAGLVAVGGAVIGLAIGNSFVWGFCLGLCPRLFWLSPKDRSTAYSGLE